MNGPGLGWRAGVLAVWAAFALYAVAGTATVPFHPDESTFLYMSRDFDLLFLQGQPGAVAWQAEGQPPLVKRYRLLDAPLGRYLAGLGRALAGQPPLGQDWDWSATWEANVAAGALPDSKTLANARLPATVLSALAGLLVYKIGARLSGRGTGATAALLFGLSGLVLLHGRRAMSEGPLLLFTVLTVWLVLRDRPNPVWVGLALAAAVASKLTALTLLPVAVVGLWLPAGQALRGPGGWRPAWRRLAVFGVAAVLGLWALHPSLWPAPVAGLRAMQAARQSFFTEQAAFVQAVAPHVSWQGPGLRTLGMIYHTYFAPLAYADVGQYAAATAASEQRYAAMPLNLGWHTASLPLNLIGGGLVLSLSVAGVIEAIRQTRRWRADLQNDMPGIRARVVVATWTFASVVGLLAVAVPAQRYYLPLVPIACLWAAEGAAALARPFRIGWRPGRSQVHTAGE
jgi:4-amino-4-deoxy-L-arabinose transferase-like glycosyltransferase